MQLFRQGSGATLNVGPILYTSGATVMSAVTLADLVRAKLIQSGTSFNLALHSGKWEHETSGNYTLMISGGSVTNTGNYRCYFQCSASSFVPFFEDFYVLHSTFWNVLTAGSWSGVTIAGVSKADSVIGSVGSVVSGVTINDFSSQAKSALGGVTIAGVSKSYGILPSGVTNILDGYVEPSYTLRGSIRLQNSVAFGKSSGGSGTTADFRDIADTKSRVSATVNAKGQRTAVDLDAT